MVVYLTSAIPCGNGVFDHHQSKERELDKESRELSSCVRFLAGHLGLRKVFLFFFAAVSRIGSCLILHACDSP